MATDKVASAPWQTRPVFISSTFKDMQAERDHLRHVVFPRLEEELRKGRLRLEPIDLRQGVETADLASEEARERMVLKVCLEEIQRSRPFLIVLLGDRYGWVPPEERLVAATQEVGFAADVHDKSVTALEIEFGILKQSPDQRRRSFFYFRDPLPYDRMPPKIAASFNDQYSTDPQTRVRHCRLVALKQSLACDPELAPRVHNYHAGCEVSTGEVTGLEAFGEMVYRHLIGELQAEIAAVGSQPPQTLEDQERAALVEFIEHRRRDFTGRQQLLDDLTNLARSESPLDAVFAIASGVKWGACITGAPGSGKSAIFAELIARLGTDESVLLLINAAGATPRGSQVEAMLERFIEELAAALGIAKPLPDQKIPDDVDATFASLLGRVTVKRRVIVLLDALNQFDETPRAQHLTWLRPKQWPANARLIATGLAGFPTEAMSKWDGIEKCEVPPLTITNDDTDDVTAIAQSVWQRYHRQVNPAVLRVLKEKHLPDGSFAAGNPLWLTLALEQINLLDADDFARAERDFPGRPAERLRAMLIDTAERMPPTVADLYGLLLEQTERIFGFAPTRAFVAAIAVSRFGWRESDLIPLIPAAARVLCPGDSVLELDDLRLASLRRSFRAHLVRRGALGQIDFFHAQMRQAVEQRVLGRLEQFQALHQVLADHLESLPPADPLRDSELMFHLIDGDDPMRAARVYADLPDPSSAFVAATQELAKHVLLGSKHQPNANADWIIQLLSQTGLSRLQLSSLAHRFTFALHDVLANTADLPSRHAVLNATRSAVQMLTEADPVNPEWRRNLSVLLSKLGDLAMVQGNLPEAQRLFGESHRTQQQQAEPAKAEWQRDLYVSFMKLGELAMAQGNLSEAERVIYESLQSLHKLAETKSADEFGWLFDLRESYDRLGQIAMAQRDPPKAQKLFGESLRISQQLIESNPANTRWQFALMTSCERLGDVAMSRRDLPEAQRLFGESLGIAKRLAESHPANAEWQRALWMSFGKLGDVALTQRDLTVAQQYWDNAYSITHRLAESDSTNAEWQRDLSVSSEKLGRVARAQGNLPEAQRLFGEQFRIAQHLAESDPINADWQRDLSMSLNNLGDLALQEGNLPEAQRRFGESLHIRKRLAETDPANAEWQRNLWYSHNRLAIVAAKSGDAAGFEAALRHCYFILRHMDQSGQYLDAHMVKNYQELDGTFGGLE